MLWYAIWMIDWLYSLTWLLSPFFRSNVKDVNTSKDSLDCNQLWLRLAPMPWKVSDSFGTPIQLCGKSDWMSSRPIDLSMVTAMFHRATPKANNCQLGSSVKGGNTGSFGKEITPTWQKSALQHWTHLALSGMAERSETDGCKGAVEIATMCSPFPNLPLKSTSSDDANMGTILIL
jgi:hypothetical protein